MAAASSTAFIKQESYQYDVFLSFSGEDTRKNFVDHLYDALQQHGIHTFKDDERLIKGNSINNQLLKSIQDSKLYIIIFSKNYASSSWCLNELVKIMECQKLNEHIAYPVFYDVDPSEVRKQCGPVGESLAKHTNKEIEKWREALTEAANLSGWDLRKTADGICRLKHLKELDLSECFELEKLPESLGDLESLNTLRVTHAKIIDVPSSICKLKHLKELDLFGCSELEKLPESIGDLESFNTLSVTFTNIREVPSSICKLKHLKKLDLSGYEWCAGSKDEGNGGYESNSCG